LLTLLTVLSGAAALLLLLPTLVLFLEVAVAVTGRGYPAVQEGGRQRLAVLMPAHDEAAIIAGTLRSLTAQLTASDRLVVIADNCSDETAAVAAAEGAQVIVRTDRDHRGKGYALDFGVRHLESDAPEIVIIVDADCRVAPGAIDRLARLCAGTGRPIQALYLMHAPAAADLKTRIAEFAWTVKNQVRAGGLRRLGLPCQLMGTGMAFTWPCISTASLATGHIVEDLKLGIELARAGTPALFCPDALVTSTFPESREGIQSQRTRWEHGHLGLILSDAPRLFAHSLRALDVNSMALALDLSVPPLALLALQVAAVWFVSLILYLLAKAQFPIGVASTAAALLLVSVLLSWWRYGRQIVSLGSLVYAVFYALYKIPLYVKFLAARQIEWVRSKRDADKH
jgi:cellulose synthase/poly-beta-1,6-N-acetylglucosamine synthase-like glycosyltransferase